MGLMKELNDLNNIYQNMYAEDEDKGYVVTAADRKGNTPAWQRYKAGKKKKDGKPMYRAADHLKNEEVEVDEGYAKPKGMKDLPKGTKVHVLRSKKDRDTWKPSTGPKGSKVKESVGTAVDKTLDAAGDIASTAVKGGAKAVGYLVGLPKGIKKSAKKGHSKGAQASEGYEISSEVEKLIESGLFSAKEIANIADIQEADIADILARLEKKRISKGGDPDESPLPAMRKYHADKKKKKVKEDYWNEFEEGYQRNPEEGEKKERAANKKYEKVRGERTPMPPRGNKRREEFERWYAANVR